MNRWFGGLGGREWRTALLLGSFSWLLCPQGQALAVDVAVDVAKSTAPLRPASCIAAARATPSDDVALANALQQEILANPLYKLLATQARRTDCRVTFHGPSKFDIDYRFGERNSLLLKRDERIEYSQWTARFSGALKEPAQAILERAQRWSFGANGCSIDWSETETQAADDDASATETIYRGAVCNCQARIRRNAHGRIDGLMLSSAY
jgi:hypothetical protein